MTLLPFPEPSALPIGLIAERRLKQSPYFFLRRLTCDYDRGVLTLRGRVPYAQLRDFAEAIVARVEGVVFIVNSIEVGDPVTREIQAVRNAG